MGGRRAAADVDGLLVAIGRCWRRRGSAPRAGDDGPPRSSVRPTRHSPPHGDIDDDADVAAAAGGRAAPWTAMSMRDRPAGCATCASRLCGAVCGNGRSPRGGRRRWFVGGNRAMLAAPRISAARRRALTTGHRAAACDQHDTRRHTATSMMLMLLLRLPAAPRGSATGSSPNTRH